MTPLVLLELEIFPACENFVLTVYTRAKDSYVWSKELLA
jgi:hypothetical protein